jgi:CHAT domain-containing protein/Tfp pilus assembly protein PilF
MKIRTAVLFVLVSLAPAAVGADLAKLSGMIRDGRTGEARARLKAAVEEYRNANDPRQEAISLLLLGFAEMELRDMAAARLSIESAATKLAASGDFFSAWMALLFVAAADISDARWEAAIRQLEVTLAMLRDAKESETPITFDAVKALGPLLKMDTSIFDLFGQQSEMMKRVLLQLCEALTRAALGGVLIELGELTRAETELERAGELSAMFMGALDGPIAAHVGDLRRRQWRFDEARKSYRKSLEGVASMPLPSFFKEPVELRVMGKLAEIELLSGRLPEALEWNDRALQFVRDRNQILREVSLLQDRARLLMQANRFAESQQVLESALAIAQRTDACLQAAILTDIGALHMFRGSYGAAMTEMEKAIEVYQTVNDPLMEGHAWTMLAEIYLGMGAFDNADLASESALALARKSRFPPAETIIEMLMAQRRWMSGDGTAAEAEAAVDAFANMAMKEAIPFTPELANVFGDIMRLADHPSPIRSANADPNVRGATAMPVFTGMTSLLDGRDRLLRGDSAGAREVWTKALEKSSSNDMRSGFLAGIGATYWKEGKAQEAAQWFRKAADLVDDGVGQIADEHLLTRYLGSPRGWYFDLVIDALAKSGNAREAFAYAERARARAFLQVIGNHRIEPRSGGIDRLVREAESLRIRISQWERDGTLPSSELDNARKRYRAVMSRVNTTSPEYASLLRIEPAEIDALQTDVPASTTLVSYFLTRTNAHAWIIDRNAIEYVRLPVTEEALRRAVCWSDRFRGAGRGGEVSRNKCEDTATAEEVFDLFVAPLRKKLRTPRLLIIPHRVLHQFPFGALRDPKSGRYLIEDYTLLFAPSASALRFLREKETAVDGGALVLGDPDSARGRLEGAQREAHAVARSLGTAALTGADATEDLLYDLGGTIDLVHIGAHGMYNSVSPLFSRIALAPGAGRDGDLNVHEILSELDLRGVNLVVLSACRTAVGERSAGDDVVGLTRAVLYAGSPGVISTLWNIDDEAAAVLMEELYCRLLGGATVADALREAQLVLLRGHVYSDPRYWGAFMLTGDPQGRFSARERR